RGARRRSPGQKSTSSIAPLLVVICNSLVPKLCLGTQVAKLRFAAPARASRFVAGREAELPDLRAQAELGHEEGGVIPTTESLSPTVPTTSHQSPSETPCNGSGA